MSAALDTRLSKPWKKPHLIESQALRWALIIGSVVYLVLAIGSFDVNWARVYRGLDRGRQFLVAFTHPDFVSRGGEIKAGMLESVVMALASTVVGIAISIPIGLGAARNISILPVYLVCRAIVAVSRALNEIVVAILLVAIFGFGPLAGFLTLSFATIGFLSKLLAEEIEDMDKVQAEAVRAPLVPAGCNVMYSASSRRSFRALSGCRSTGSISIFAKVRCLALSGPGVLVRR